MNHKTLILFFSIFTLTSLYAVDLPAQFTFFCTGNAQCDDNNPCTTDTCEASGGLAIKLCQNRPRTINGRIQGEDCQVNRYQNRTVWGICRNGQYTCDPNSALPDYVCTPGSRQAEVCDTLDNNCDGRVDESEETERACYTGEDGTAGIGVCRKGTQLCDPQRGVYSNVCAGQILPGLDNDCDGIDDDCDGEADEDVDEAGASFTYYRDVDGDGFGNPEESLPRCGAIPPGYVRNQDDCNDANASINPSALEICDPARVDENCNGSANDNDPSLANNRDYHWYQDGDNDEWGAGKRNVSCVAPMNGRYVHRFGDCDDANPDINPGVEEICDGINNSCNELFDHTPDGYLVGSCYSGTPGTQGVGVCRAGTGICLNYYLQNRIEAAQPQEPVWGRVINAGTGEVEPRVCFGEVVDQPELCDGLDNDCNGVVDDLGVACFDGPAEVVGVGICRVGRRLCDENGRFGDCVGDVLPRAELCDGVDDDNCDGTVDEGCDCINGEQRECYEGPDGTNNVGICRVGLQTCAMGRWGGCVDQVLPKVEVCDGIDNDCDGLTDESDVDPNRPLSLSCFDADPALIGIGICRAGEWLCVNGGFGACQGQVLPGGIEQCDGARLDENCNGVANEDCECVAGQTRPCGEDRGVCEAGIQECRGGLWAQECQGQVGPSGEVCDGLDNDCDGATDEGPRGESLTIECYSGPDGTHGVGTCREGVRVCLNGQFNPLCIGERVPGQELCNGLDNDCDGLVDFDDVNDCQCVPGSRRDCGDAPNQGECVQGSELCSDNFRWSGNCEGELLPPENPEVACDSLDNDCDGEIDENCACVQDESQPCGRDEGQCQQGLQFCDAGAWGICEGLVGPSDEVCDGLDNNCNGAIDERISLGENCQIEGQQGVCVFGREQCVDGAMNCVQLLQPSAELCDGRDNDCNGVVDDGEGLECILGSENCNDQCRRPHCGDGVINRVDEACDGADLGVQSCETRDFSGGTLACTPECTIDESACLNDDDGDDEGDDEDTPILEPVIEPEIDVQLGSPLYVCLAGSSEAVNLATGEIISLGDYQCDAVPLTLAFKQEHRDLVKAIKAVKEGKRANLLDQALYVRNTVRQWKEQAGTYQAYPVFSLSGLATGTVQAHSLQPAEVSFRADEAAPNDILVADIVVSRASAASDGSALPDAVLIPVEELGLKGGGGPFSGCTLLR
jgi:hypothetical protein